MPKWHHSDSHSNVEDSKTTIKHCMDAKTRLGVWLPGFRTDSKWRKQADAAGFFKSRFLTLSFIILFYTFDMFNRTSMWVTGTKKTFCCNLFKVDPKYSVDWLDYTCNRCSILDSTMYWQGKYIHYYVWEETHSNYLLGRTVTIPSVRFPKVSDRLNQLDIMLPFILFIIYNFGYIHVLNWSHNGEIILFALDEARA